MESKSCDAFAVYPRARPGETGPRQIEIFGWINFRDTPPNDDDCALLASDYCAGFTAYTAGSKIIYERQAHLENDNDLQDELARLERKISEHFGYSLMRIRYHS